MSIGVQIVDLCSEGLCLEESAGAVVSKVQGFRPHFCSKHLEKFRAMATERGLVEGREYSIEVRS
jgi:hypothetical protein